MSFARVSKKSPCPVCQKPDWCRVFADGWVECMRVQSGMPARSGGFMHRLGGAPQPYVPPARITEAPAINATKLWREWNAATTTEQVVELMITLGLNDFSSLYAVGAAWAEPHNAWAFPMRDGYGNIVGIRLRNERGKFAVRGSRQGIFVSNEPGTGSIEPEEGDKSGRAARAPTLFVCEGPTDTAAAIDLGLFAAGRPNCCCGGPEIKIYARRHAVARVVVVSDNDKPGLDGALKVGGQIKVPFAIYVPPARDLREFVQLGGTRAMIENTLKGTIWRNGSR